MCITIITQPGVQQRCVKTRTRSRPRKGWNAAEVFLCISHLWINARYFLDVDSLKTNKQIASRTISPAAWARRAPTGSSCASWRTPPRPPPSATDRQAEARKSQPRGRQGPWDVKKYFFFFFILWERSANVTSRGPCAPASGSRSPSSTGKVRNFYCFAIHSTVGV